MTYLSIFASIGAASVALAAFRWIMRLHLEVMNHG